MHVININSVDLHPPVLCHVIQIVDAPAHGVPVTRVIDRPLPQVDRLLHRQIGLIIRVQHAVRVRAPGSHREVPPVQPRAVVVDVVQLGTGLVPSRDHGSHGQSVPAVAAHRVREQLRRGRDGDALLVPQFVHAALRPQVAFPEAAVGGPAGHGPEEEGIDLDDLLDGPGGDVRSHGRAGVDTDDDPSVELEGEGGRSLGEFHVLFGVGVSAGGGEVVSAEVGGICHVRNLELARLPQCEAWHHGPRADGALVAAAAVELVRPDVEDVVADCEGGAEHDADVC
mmetsp:Transcript_15945/g.34729  ORF Transcript_15945/g.34729 Transcript_15945/m.34729 type:complete len:283 (-) Transcript_15945:147-995(-)